MEALFKNLDANVEYEIVDVDFIRRSKYGRSYDFRTVFKYRAAGITYFRQRYANIQFLRKVRIGAHWKGRRMLDAPDVQLLKIPPAFLKAKPYCTSALKFLSEEFIHRGIVDHKDQQYIGPHEQRICVYPLEVPIEVNGQSVAFVTVPTFEIFRFFLAGNNKFNETLLSGTFTAEDSSNKMFNPTASKEIQKDGKMVKVIRLRKEIADRNAVYAGDVRYNKQIRSIAERFAGYASASESEKWRGFTAFYLPVRNADSFEAYAKFVRNKNGVTGIEVKSIAEINYQKDIYVVERDNDARSLPGDKSGKPKSFGGPRKKRQKDKRDRKKKIEGKLGDNSIESTPINQLLEGPEWKDRSLEFIKGNKTNQEYVADQKTDGGDIGDTGIGANSKNADSDGKTAPVDDDTIIGKDDISETKYWEGFPVIIEQVLEKLGIASARYFSSSSQKNQSATTLHYKYLGSKDIVEMYFIEIEYNYQCYYLIEYNPEIFDLPTILIWPTEDDRLDAEQCRMLLEKAYEEEGSATDIVEQLKEDFTLMYKIIKHQYEIRKTDPRKYYQAEAALENQARKISEYIIKHASR